MYRKVVGVMVILEAPLPPSASALKVKNINIKLSLKKSYKFMLF